MKVELPGAVLSRPFTDLRNRPVSDHSAGAQMWLLQLAEQTCSERSDGSLSARSRLRRCHAATSVTDSDVAILLET